MPNVIDNPDLYASINLAGVLSPGQVTLSGHDREAVWDVRRAPFSKGATVALNIIPPIAFTASFYLVKDASQGVDDFAKWEDFQKLIDSTVASPQKPTALAIYHPDLARNGITQVVKAKIGGMVYDGKGGATVAVKFQEYTGAPKAWSGLPKPKPKNNPNAALFDEVGALVQQFHDTPNG